MNTIAGLDIGYGYTKVVTRKKHTVDQTTEATFRSVIGPAVEIKYRSDLIGSQRNHQIQLDARNWFTGETALLQSPFTISPRTRDRDPELMRVLMLDALHRAGITEGSTEIVTGLPVEWYTDREALHTALWGPHLFRVNDEPHRLTVSDILVVPQPFGSFFSVLLSNRGKLSNPNKLARGRVGIIDVGLYTTDYAVSDDLRYVEPLSGSIPMAMAKVYELIQRGVQKNLGRSITLQEAEDVAASGRITDRGEEQGCLGIVRQARGSVGKVILDRAQTLWGDGRDLSAVLVTGGGSQHFVEPISEVYPHTRIVDHPQMANAIGFYRYALRKFRQ